MRVLLTGFEPFGGESVNPSMEVVRQVEREGVPGVEVDCLVLPVARAVADGLLLERLGAGGPDALVMLGEAGARTQVTPERVAINVDAYPIADNAGQQPRDEPVVAGGPAAYFSTLPLGDMTDGLEAAGIPAGISNSAGTFLCNRVFYRAMHHLHGNQEVFAAGFVHLPYLHEQVKGRREAVASMSLDTLTRATRVLLEVLRDAPRSLRSV